MPRKTKSKQRLDKYYNLAKDQGYRSRAAFKLFQLNKKYNFLNGANAVVDLCAAPGGWMQVCSQIMPLGSTIIGLDIVSIKAIPGCKAFQQDITTPACIQLLKRELPSKADVFLHDGAPNVGANWSKDAYNQNDLVLSSLKVASQFLKKGGTFVTKVFRSADYNSLIWVFNKFFSKVEATKPLASRFVSAEIFVVCLDYLAPEYIDEKLFESKHVFKENEADIQGLQQQKEITSIDKVLKDREHRHRGGYADDVHQIVYQAIPFQEFLKVQNPYPVFIQYNKIQMTQEDKDTYLALCKPPPDLENILEDIKVIGKREITQILKWRSKIKHVLEKKKAEEKKALKGDQKSDDEEPQSDLENLQQSDQEPSEHDEDDIDDIVEKQKLLLEGSTVQDKKSELKEQRKLKQKRLAQEKKLVGKGVNMHFENEDEELFDFFKHKNIKNLGYVELDPNADNVTTNVKRQHMKFATQEELDENLEMIYENKKGKIEHGVTKLKEKKLAKKLQHQKEKDVDITDDKLACKPMKKVKKDTQEDNQVDLNSKFFDRDIFAQLKQQLGAPSTFNNPLKSKKLAKEEAPEEQEKKKKVKKPQLDSDGEEIEEEEVDGNHLQRQVQEDLEGEDYYIDEDAQDDEFERRLKISINQDAFPDEDKKVKQYELTVPISEMEQRRRKLKKQAAKEERKTKKNADDDPNKQVLEIVPEKKLQDYDIDELAENLALAKKMLRKKTREQIIDNSFGAGRYDDHDELPKWFADDEERHVYKIQPISKEEYNTEKQRLMEINNRVPKKIMEAKIRKYKKTQQSMKKAASKAQQVFETEGLNERTKMEQVKKIYKREQSILSKEKSRKYIVSKKGQSGMSAGKQKKSKTIALVDKRLKKDKRAQKAQAKRVGAGKKRKHVSRRKGR